MDAARTAGTPTPDRINQPERITLRRPDDWHLHLRDGAMLRAVLPWTVRQMGRAIIMPNLVPPVTTSAKAVAYRAEIEAALPAGSRFRPLLTCYLTDTTDPDDLALGWDRGTWVAAKLYPAHATTNAAHGVRDVRTLAPVFERMQALGMPLLVHGEVTDPAVDIFDREAVFLERVLAPLVAAFPRLKVVLEHATTAESVAFVRRHGPSGRVAATITAHHLLINRTDLFAGGIRPHLYCLPVAKREGHRRALCAAVASGEPWFFLGTDSAPHPIHAKEAACGCAGIFTAPVALELYAMAFEAEGALDRLEGFASLHGPAFYGLPANDGTVTLERSDLRVPDRVPVGDGDARSAVLPFRAGETLPWRFVD